MNKDYYVVRESAEEIVQKIIDYNAKIYEWHQKICCGNEEISGGVLWT